MTTAAETRAICDRMKEAREKVLDADAVTTLEDGEHEDDVEAAHQALKLARDLLREALKKRGAL